jgi:signal transduction histidine kinase
MKDADISPNELRQAACGDSRRFILNALEIALSVGDFQKEVHNRCTPQMILRKAAERILRLIHFEACAVFLVEEETCDLQLSVCLPAPEAALMEEELSFLVHNGSVAWAMRERRGIVVRSRRGRRMVAHVMSTYARTRGLFIGLLPETENQLPDASLEILSIIMRHVANGIESLDISAFLSRQNTELEKAIEEKTRRLLGYEKQLLQAQSMETVAALAGGVAHQFNNALTALIGYLDLADMNMDNASQVASYIERIRPVTERMSTLTNNLLAYAQGGKYQTSVLSSRKLLLEVQPAIERSVKKSVRISIEPGDETLTFQADMIQMRMAVLAVVENADESIAGEGTIHIRCYPVHSRDLDEEMGQVLQPGEYVCLSIRDNGQGMDENTVRRIFEPFFSTKFEGRGLSMAAVFGIIKNHRGWITVKSKIGRGTIVDIYLPLAVSEKRASD